MSPNRLQRRFNPNAPDERWITSLTEAIGSKSTLDIVVESGTDLAQGYYCKKILHFLFDLKKFILFLLHINASGQLIARTPSLSLKMTALDGRYNILFRQNIFR